jgi:hypothetical protein
MGSVRSRKASQLSELTGVFGYEVSGFAFLCNVADRMGDLKNDAGAKILRNDLDSDAVRHFTWMYSTATFYGVDKAWKAGDIHERLGNGSEELFRLYKEGTGQDLSYLRTLNNAPVPSELHLTRPSNMSKQQFSDLLDSVMDYQNNRIAINASRSFSGKASGREAAEAAIEYFHQNGLTSYQISADGNSATVVGNRRISDAEYNAFRQELMTLGHDGYRPRAKEQPQKNQPSQGPTASEQTTENLRIASALIDKASQPTHQDPVPTTPARIPADLGRGGYG